MKYANLLLLSLCFSLAPRFFRFWVVQVSFLYGHTADLLYFVPGSREFSLRFKDSSVGAGLSYPSSAKLATLGKRVEQCGLASHPMTGRSHRTASCKQTGCATDQRSALIISNSIELGQLGQSLLQRQ
ncbi:hypothetical protein GALMADRAFT_1132639 [Galerina marginata CBS 339.88]|uniref:Uncharacterized protein n=1 Tax=Galerina marginata (strain CBS 339.88) TaxID=685588 RepID=A0A067SJT8_GALM3|nr:hypothetical protein GALMADRAFT_1132639 [Galerina marginata CBS 339.88]